MNKIAFKIRFCFMRNLVFCFLFYACTEKKKEVLSIQWQENKPVAISILRESLPLFDEDSITKLLQVNISGNQTAILGDFSLTHDLIIFHPLISLTRGLNYEVRASGKFISEIKIPLSEISPSVVAVYPQPDTLPENLLKFYIYFSAPMQEGTALKNILLLKNSKDTVHAAFLDLQQELWNSDRTILTLWLDPGRIKRDLIPNKEMGPPLEEGNSYELFIGKDWSDATGNSLLTSYRKKFFTVTRDSLSPDPDQWTVNSPAINSTKALRVDFHETLDYVLLNSAIHILNAGNEIIHGTIQIDSAQAVLSFTPASQWEAGKYTIEVESRLEDLAGNNIEHPFDNDLYVQKNTGRNGLIKLNFVVK